MRTFLDRLNYAMFLLLLYIAFMTLRVQLGTISVYAVAADHAVVDRVQAMMRVLTQ